MLSKKKIHGILSILLVCAHCKLYTELAWKFFWCVWSCFEFDVNDVYCAPVSIIPRVERLTLQTGFWDFLTYYDLREQNYLLKTSVITFFTHWGSRVSVNNRSIVNNCAEFTQNFEFYDWIWLWSFLVADLLAVLF